MSSDIAIIGMAGRFPGASDLEEFWRNLRAARECVVTLDDARLRANGVAESLYRRDNYVRTASVVSGIEYFDADFFGYAASEAELIDPQQRLFLECAWETIEDAGVDPATFPGQIGIYAGAKLNSYFLHNLFASRATRPDAVGFQALTGNDKDYLTSRVAFKLNLKGPAITVQTACSTSLVAVHLACEALLNGQCDLALAGAVAVKSPQEVGYLHHEGSIDSTDGHCRPFDRDANGIVEGNGLGCVALVRLETAQRHGSRIRAIIRGTAVNNDGAGKLAFTAPSEEGQIRVITEAHHVAGVNLAAMGYLETHGTGTPLGDAVELAALTKVLRAAGKKPTASCALGSVKANIGHLDVAAGIAGLIKTVLILERGEIPPLANFRAPNPALDFAGGAFRIPTGVEPWPRQSTPRCAGVSSFGIGGTNAHVVLQEAGSVSEPGKSRPVQVITLSARTPAALEGLTQRTVDQLQQGGPVPLADFAYTLGVGRRGQTHRRSVVGRTPAEIVARLTERDRKWVVTETAGARVPVLFAFPGQGTQHSGMAAELYAAEPTFRKHIDRCDEIARAGGVENLREHLLQPDGDFTDTRLVQPSLLAVEIGLARLFMSWGIEPAGMIGHSLGEYAAACVAGTFSLEDALQLAIARGRLMSETNPGAMSAVGASATEFATELSSRLAVAAINGPAQFVVAGAVDEVAAFEQRLARRNVTTQRLRTNLAFHSPTMDAVLGRFAAECGRVQRQRPQIPFISGVTGMWIGDEAMETSYWTRHLRETVQFDAGLRTALAIPHALVLELGPGRTIAGLVAQQPATVRRTTVQVMPALYERRSTLECLATAVGRVWVAGVGVDWQRYYTGEQRRIVSVPGAFFERKKYWIAPPMGAMGIHSEESVRQPTEHEDAGVALQALRWTRQDRGTFAAPAHDRPWLLIGSPPELTEMIRALATIAGTIAITADANWQAQLSELSDADTFPSCVFFFLLSDANGARLPDEPASATPRFSDTVHLVRLLGRKEVATSLVMVTDKCFNVTGTEQKSAAREAVVMGPLRAAAAEYPRLQARHVDVDSDSHVDQMQLARQIVAEAGLPQAGLIALRGRARWICEPVAVSSADRPLESRLRVHGVYLITGGLGELGLTIAEHLAQRWQGKLVLIARRSLPARESWPAIAAGTVPTEPSTAAMVQRLVRIEQQSSGLEVLVADVAEGTKIRHAVDQACERFGRIDGVFHAAGIFQGGLLEHGGGTEYGAVLRPKICGTEALRFALRDSPPGFVLLFSSSSAFYSNRGEAAYSSANAFLIAAAMQWRHETGAQVSAVAWGGWQIGMPFAALPSRAVNHPLIHQVRRLAPRRHVCFERLTPGSHWLLREHRVGGVPVVPATGLLDIVLAALKNSLPTAIDTVYFSEPLALRKDEPRDLLVVLDTEGDDTAFSICSRPVAGELAWTEHVRGGLRRTAPPPPPAIDLAALLGRCTPVVIPPVTEAGFVEWGPRWRSLRRVAKARDECVAEFELPVEYEGDLEGMALHPALLDIALSFATSCIDAGKVLPAMMSGFAVYGRLPRKITSHARLRRELSDRDMVVLEVLIYDENGRPVVSVDRFVLAAGGQEEPETKRERRSAVPSATARRVMHELDRWIHPAEGVRALERILALPLDVDYLVTKRATPLPAESPLKDASPANGRHARPSLASEFIAPSSPDEQTAARLWAEVLGLERVGVADNFDDLGGDSSMAIRLVARLREELDATLTVRELMEKRTIRALVGRTELVPTAVG